MAMEAFDLAERFQTLVFVMSDLDLGMNIWMSHAVHLSREADRSRQGARRGDAEAARASGAATRTSTATASRTARFRAPACRRTSRAARATTTTAPTASGRTTTSTTSTGWRASSRPRGKHVPQPVVERRAGAEIGIIGYGTSHWAIDESRDQLREETRLKTVVPPPARVSVHRRSSTAFIDAHERVYVVEQNRDAQMLQLMQLELHAGATRRSCAACCTTTACRSTPAASPTTCWRRKASKCANKTAVAAASVGVRRAMTDDDDHDRHRPEAESHRPRAAAVPAAARRRSAPAAATTRSPSASSTRSTRWASTRSRSSSCRASAARARARRTSSAASHGFNAVHGRMPSVGTGAMLANQQADRDRHQRRRRHRRDRHRPVRPPDAPQPADHLHHRGQRLLRPDQGAVLADRRPRLEAQDRRRQRPAADRHLRAGRSSSARRSSRARSRATRSSCCRSSRRRSRTAAR